MWWILIALFSPLCFGAANILDQFIANRRLPSLAAFLFYSSLLNLVVLPIVLIVSPPVWPSAFLFGVVVFLGLMNFLYIYPYYRALQKTDTSVVVSLFSLANIFIPILSYFLVGERLTPWQYAGFVLIITASTLLTFNIKKFRLDSSLGLMIIASLTVTLESVGFKYVFEHGVTWGTAVSGQMFFSFLCVLPMLLIPQTKKKIVAGWSLFKKSLPLFVLDEFLTFGGAAAATLAMTLAPLTLEKTVEAFQPLFVLVLAVIFSRLFPKMFKERIDAKALRKKLFFFAVMIFGIYLMAG